ncbi:MAG: dihydroxyacetone kinase subunit DhaK [Clostridiales bacterium]|nr:dihydroxyacetone kinase subunit DhaK [Clostridiales bacterium]
MKKFINDRERFVEDSLLGILQAYPDYLASHPNDLKAIAKRFPDDSKVSIITGGGYGHLPLFLGYVGEGLCDGAAVGNIFSTPSSNTVFLTTSLAPKKRGILYIIGNYLGDIMNFEMGADLAHDAGIKTRTVIVSDDAASAPRSEWKDRRGVAGLVFAYKIAGAAARRGKSLDEVYDLTARACERMASYGAAFTPCQLPDTNAPVFAIGEDEMELGIGMHGEPGVRRTKIMQSEDIAELAVGAISEDLRLKPGDDAAVILNGLGATPSEELHLFYSDALKSLRNRGISVSWKRVGECATSLEMSGASICMMKLDGELLGLLDEPAFSPFVHFFSGKRILPGEGV